MNNVMNPKVNMFFWKDLTDLPDDTRWILIKYRETKTGKINVLHGSYDKLLDRWTLDRFIMRLDLDEIEILGWIEMNDLL